MVYEGALRISQLEANVFIFRGTGFKYMYLKQNFHDPNFIYVYAYVSICNSVYSSTNNTDRHEDPSE